MGALSWLVFLGFGGSAQFEGVLTTPTLVKLEASRAFSHTATLDLSSTVADFRVMQFMASPRPWLQVSGVQETSIHFSVLNNALTSQAHPLTYVAPLVSPTAQLPQAITYAGWVEDNWIEPDWVMPVTILTTIPRMTAIPQARSMAIQVPLELSTHDAPSRLLETVAPARATGVLAPFRVWDVEPTLDISTVIPAAKPMVHIEVGDAVAV